MHAYLLLLGVTPLEVAASYDMLPLHCTLVHWFWLEQPHEEVATYIAKALRGMRPMALTAENEHIFTGKNKNGEAVPVKVNKIKITPELRDLHERACGASEAMDVRYSEPQYVRAGFNPHVTHQKDGRLTSGEVRKANTVYLVEAAAPEYGNDRTVRAAFHLM